MPKILMLTNRIPYPLKDGGSLAMHYFLEGYIEAGVEVSLLSMQTTRHHVDTSKLPSNYKQLKIFKTVDVDNSIKPWAAFKNLFTKESYNIARFVNETYEKELIALLQTEDYDFVQLESLYLCPYVDAIRKYSKAKIILRSHNIEYKIWERLSLQAKNPLKHWYLKLLTRRLKQYEHDHLNDFDIILPISTKDEAFYREAKVEAQLFTIAFGIKISAATQSFPSVDVNSNPLKFYHLGAMDWLPNIEAVEWLAKEVMPIVSAKNLPIELYLAGRNMSASTQELAAKDIIIVGEVENAQAFEADKHILCVPLLSGGGVRIKIFEAMSQGKAIITTSVGCEGMAAQDEQEILVADTPEAFAEKILRLYEDRNRILTLGQKGKQLIETQYNREQQIQELLHFLTNSNYPCS